MNRFEEDLLLELREERRARQRAEARLADKERQLRDVHRELHWLQGSTEPSGSRLHWSADEDEPDLNKVVC